MDPVAQAWLEIIVGVVFCYVGYSAARVLIGLWGTAVGGLLGWMLLDWFTWRAPSLGALDWLPYVVVVGLALAGAWLAFAFYSVGVLVALGSLGWVLGGALSTSLHLVATAAVGAGVLVAGIVVIAGWVLELPRVLLILATALLGAATVTGAVARLLAAELAWFDQRSWTAQPWLHVAWLAGFLAIAVSGMLVQRRAKSEPTLREAYRH